MTDSKDLVKRLRERAALAIEEGDMTAKCDAEYFSQSAELIEAQGAALAEMAAQSNEWMGIAERETKRAEAAEAEVTALKAELERFR